MPVGYATLIIGACSGVTVLWPMCLFDYAKGQVREDMARRCEIEGCGRKHYGRGLCAAHYRRWQRRGDVMVDVPIGPSKIDHNCIVDGCEAKAIAKDLCNRHYMRNWRYGDPLGGGPKRKKRG